MTENLMPHRGSAHRPTRLRSAGVIGVAGIAGVAMGLGATSLALWNDDVSFDGSISSGYEYFAAGVAGAELSTASSATAPPDGEAVTVTVGPEEAETLAQDGELAVVWQTESLSQGNKGLQYTLAPPQDWGEGYFGSSEVHLYWVDQPGQCTVGGQEPALPGDGHVTAGEDGGFTSTPVSGAYSDTEAPVAEYWCLTATLGDLPDEGDYTNEATVSAQDPAGKDVTDTDRWSAEVATAMDPGQENDHALTFTYHTFRPGEVTTP